MFAVYGLCEDYSPDGDKAPYTNVLSIHESLEEGSTWEVKLYVAVRLYKQPANTNKQFFKVLKYRKTYAEVKGFNRSNYL